MIFTKIANDSFRVYHRVYTFAMKKNKVLLKINRAILIARYLT